jgi:Flp pilus assembly protein TadG
MTEPRNNSMKRLLCERGQATVIVALSLLVLLGFVGFGVDVGLLFHAKRTMQTAADAAAIAGADDEFYAKGSGSAAAKAAATANGYTDGTNGTTVTPNSPPLSGVHTGPAWASAVEVIVSQPQKTLFMALFGFSSVPVSARAVAVKGAVSKGCIYVLSPNAKQAMQVQGKFHLDAPNCGIIVNSNNADALDFNGNSGTLDAGSVGVRGGCSGTCAYTSTSTGNTIGIPSNSAAPITDPLSYYTPPKLSGCTAPSGGKLTGTVSPGCYSGNVTISNATLSAGLYEFTGNVTLGGTVSGSAVTLYIQQGLKTSTNTTLNLDGTGATAYPGTVIYADRSDTGTLELDLGNNGALGTIKGVIYAPSMEFFLNDNGGGGGSGCPSSTLTLVTDLIVNTFYQKASCLTMTSYSLTYPNSTPLTKVVLVE